MSDDLALQARVMEELAWDPAVDPAQIGVAARHGVVTLSGIVESFAAKAAAERAAGRVRGVRAIATEIEVRLPADHHRADAEIAERALRLLEWDVEVPHERIRLRVEHGLVTLTGEVGYHFQRAAAEADLRRLGGVRGVTNLIRVVPAEAPAVEPTWCAGRSRPRCAATPRSRPGGSASRSAPAGRFCAAGWRPGPNAPWPRPPRSPRRA